MQSLGRCCGWTGIGIQFKTAKWFCREFWWWLLIVPPWLVHFSACHWNLHHSTLQTFSISVPFYEECWLNSLCLTCMMHCWSLFETLPTNLTDMLTTKMLSRLTEKIVTKWKWTCLHVPPSLPHEPDGWPLDLPPSYCAHQQRLFRRPGRGLLHYRLWSTITSKEQLN